MIDARAVQEKLRQQDKGGREDEADQVDLAPKVFWGEIAHITEDAAAAAQTPAGFNHALQGYALRREVQQCEGQHAKENQPGCQYAQVAALLQFDYEQIQKRRDQEDGGHMGGHGSHERQGRQGQTSPALDVQQRGIQVAEHQHAAQGIALHIPKEQLHETAAADHQERNQTPARGHGVDQPQQDKDEENTADDRKKLE